MLRNLSCWQKSRLASFWKSLFELATKQEEHLKKRAGLGQACPLCLCNRAPVLEVVDIHLKKCTFTKSSHLGITSSLHVLQGWNLAMCRPAPRRSQLQAIERHGPHQAVYTLAFGRIYAHWDRTSTMWSFLQPSCDSKGFQQLPTNHAGKLEDLSPPLLSL